MRVVGIGGDDGELRPWDYTYVYSIEQEGSSPEAPFPGACPAILHKTGTTLKLSGNEVYYTACS